MVVRTVARQQSGDLLVHVQEENDSQNLIDCAFFGGIPVTVQPHKFLNSSRGVIKSHELQGCKAEDFVRELDGVTHARQIKLRRDGKEILTNTWVLTNFCLSWR